ncbi:Arginase/deacetylase [Rhodotorula sp. JG-1b]|nr:Arginase/deacetylase [Rhodotorula sp. JG-1b]
MRSVSVALAAATAIGVAAAHATHHDAAPPSEEAWASKYGGSPDLSFSGITTFARTPHARCLDEPNSLADIVILGMPFDTSVSYRPGARFGPNAIRQGSRRMAKNRGYSIPWNFNPFMTGASIMDCGDVPISPYDNTLALDQIETAYTTLLSREVATDFIKEHGGTKSLALDGKEHPKIISLGGDHTIVLPILRSLAKVYGPVAVIHFDAHLDTWNGAMYTGALTPQSQVTHGSFFWKASTEGLISNTSSIHAGIRTRLSEFEDLTHDSEVGFKLLTTDDIDELKPSGIIKAIKERVGGMPVYLSLDIDVVDPSMAPATGTPESGGWTTRELKAILRGLSSLHLVGLDIVEVSPPFDTNAELTAMAAADLVQEFLGMLLKGKGPQGKEQWAPAVKQMVLHDEREEAAHKAAHDEL